MRREGRLTLVLIGMLILAFNIQPGKAESLPLISLKPSKYTAQLGDTFTIALNVFDVTDYYGFDMWLHYNSTIIEHVNITVDGPGQVAPTYLGHRDTMDVSVLGTIKYSCVFVGAAGTPSFNGSGTLAWITFKANNVGSTALNFNTYWTFLYYRNATIIPMGPPLNGSVTVIPRIPPPVGGMTAPINEVAIKPQPQTPWIWLSTIILSLVLTVVYVKKRKRNTEINS